MTIPKPGEIWMRYRSPWESHAFKGDIKSVTILSVSNNVIVYREEGLSEDIEEMNVTYFINLGYTLFKAKTKRNLPEWL